MQVPDVEAWFRTIEPSGDLDGPFAHLRLLQQAACGWECVRAKLVAYLELAHRDARNHFHSDLGLDLDPFGDGGGPVSYPGSLPQEALLGYFGEAFCGIVSQLLPTVGRRAWTAPAFLFRLHNAAAEHLHRLIYGEPVPPQIAGRTGSDFIALCLDDQHRVQAVLAGEAKCHAKLNITAARSALQKMGTQAATPVSLGQLKRILGDLPALPWRNTVR